VVGSDPHRDARGLFARLYCPEEFERCTMRGMHFQKPPFAESKLVRVVRGRALDVALDLRPGPGRGAGSRAS
jgi:dTDP-4-dehydrorhamnose 3,5-epimerase